MPMCPMIMTKSRQTQMEAIKHQAYDGTQLKRIQLGDKQTYEVTTTWYTKALLRNSVTFFILN